MKTKVSLNNSIPRLLKDQSVVTATFGVERIHGICIKFPKNLEIQVKCPKTKESVFFEGNNKKYSKILIPPFMVSDLKHKYQCYKRKSYEWKEGGQIR